MITIILSSILLFGSIILLIIMIIKKPQKKKTDQEENISIDKNSEEILPHLLYDDANECFIQPDGSCIDFVRIKSKDLINASEDEINYDQYRYTKLYKIYSDDLKIIAMNFPCSTQIQQAYLRKKIEGTKNQKKKYWLQKRMDELIWLEKNRTTREYYYMLYSANIESHLSNMTSLFSALESGRNGMCEKISKEQKIQVMYKMNNKSSLIT